MWAWSSRYQNDALPARAARGPHFFTGTGTRSNRTWSSYYSLDATSKSLGYKSGSSNSFLQYYSGCSNPIAVILTMDISLRFNFRTENARLAVWEPKRSRLKKGCSNFWCSVIDSQMFYHHTNNSRLDQQRQVYIVWDDTYVRPSSHNPNAIAMPPKHSIIHPNPKLSLPSSSPPSPTVKSWSPPYPSQGLHPRHIHSRRNLQSSSSQRGPSLDSCSLHYVHDKPMPQQLIWLRPAVGISSKSSGSASHIRHMGIIERRGVWKTWAPCYRLPWACPETSPSWYVRLSMLNAPTLLCDKYQLMVQY